MQPAMNHSLWHHGPLSDRSEPHPRRDRHLCAQVRETDRSKLYPWHQRDHMGRAQGRTDNPILYVVRTLQRTHPGGVSNGRM